MFVLLLFGPLSDLSLDFVFLSCIQSQAYSPHLEEPRSSRLSASQPQIQEESSLLSTTPHTCQHWRNFAGRPISGPITVLGQFDALIFQAWITCPP